MAGKPIKNLVGLFLVLVLLVTSFGCQVTTAISSLSRQATTPGMTQQPSPIPKPNPPGVSPQTTATPPAAQLTTLPSVSSNVSLVEAVVTRVIDGDTIEVSISGKLYTVRYIGMNTPETVDPNRLVEPYGIEASNMNKELVGGKIVILEKDVSETDRYGRLLRYVYVGNLFINAELVRLGYAQIATYPPDVKYQDLFLQLQVEAREANRGLWGVGPTTPAQSPSPAPVPGSSVLSLQIVSVTSPVSSGGTATLIAQTLPGADCSITVYYKSGPSSASGLDPKPADNSGKVSWTWKVGASTTPGSWRIVVNAISGGKTVSQETYFTVR